MIIDRILEAVLIVVAIRTGVQWIEFRRGTGEMSSAQLLRSQRTPVVAIIFTTVLIIGALSEVVWSGALNALRTDSSADQWWRTFTAPFVQEGVAGAIFNIVTAAIVLALAEWCWGRWMAAGIWLLAAWAPIGDLARYAGYHVSSRDTTAYSAGSSGATYFTAATLCVVLLFSARGRVRLLGLVGPAVAALMWAVENDGHGVLFIEGTVVGLLLWLIVRAAHLPTPSDTSIEQSEQPVS